MHGRKRILVVDVDENVLIRLEKILEDAGFETTTTWDPEAAISLLRADGFDLLLVGDHPPEVSARELLTGLGALPRPPSCVVLQLTGTFNRAEYIEFGVSAVECRHRVEDMLRAIGEQLGELKFPRAA